MDFQIVNIDRADEYAVDEILNILRKHFIKLGITDGFFAGKKVAIKPNLVSAKAPEFAVTTHPTVIEATYKLISEFGADNVVLAESPGGPYSPVVLSRIYKVTGMTELANRIGLKLNDDFSSVKRDFKDGKKLKQFDIISPIEEADIILNICKLKTHSLTGLSCAVKNLFGVVPGTLKFELHAAYSKVEDFCEMLVDLNLSLMKDKTIINICDGIVGMEGNGPTHGNAVHTGVILSSLSGVALDIVAEKYIGNEGETVYLDIGAERLGLPRKISNDIFADIVPMNLRHPDSSAGSLLKNLPNYFGGSLAEFFEPKPKINRSKCIGCGKCEDYCPQHTISMKTMKGKKYGKIDYKKCIRCYCCQELCPIGAVDTVKNLLIRLVH